ncbi:hypothetical protein EK21DRAFT_109495 [Setomelanomma holmii]|uniref:Wax synthase domain-containing protein n=1 Tax=Setomelanomma holmii TaxID=210430 RepID=A0A9P4LPD3_9PLEO|nr:hypothetical protein EK21DRAFT_109495 [Setomelanomma holmii]
MVHFIHNSPSFLFRQIINSLTIDVYDNYDYSFRSSIPPLLAILIAFAWALYILAYPPPDSLYRKLCLVALGVPTAYAFARQNDVSPSYAVNDTFGRFVYIWFAVMSYEVTVLEYTPVITKENDGWKSRLKEAYKMLFCRAPSEQIVPDERTGQARITHTPRHDHSRARFLAVHAWKLSYLYLLQNIWHVFTSHCIYPNHAIHGSPYASFFRRLPESLEVGEIWTRIDVTMQWCVINMFLYEAHHSLFAIIFVGLHLDAPYEWSMTLFGPLSTAWSVRRYWGKHWHNFVYQSFSGHVKVVTRQWLKLPRCTLKRLLENTLVFGASGLAHSAVRWAQDPDGGDYWVITFWYVGQMVPIIIEGVVQDAWKQKKKKLGIDSEGWIEDGKWLSWAERALGYVWVLGWNMWSIPKYVHTREEWADAAMRGRYRVEEKIYQEPIVRTEVDREL